MTEAHCNALQQKINDKSFVLGVIGLGYVGLPLSLTFLRKGIKVIGFDLDQKKINKIGKGESYIKHIKADDLANFVGKGLFQATADFSASMNPTQF